MVFIEESEIENNTMIILYTFLAEEKHQYFLSKFLNYFPEKFKHKVLGFRKWEDAQLSLLGRVLLCHGLNKYHKISELSIELSLNGKPCPKLLDFRRLYRYSSL